MEYREEEQNGYRVLYLSGEVDLACARHVRDLIIGAIDSGGHLAIDLHEVPYIDSSGIASLVEGFQKCRAEGRGFALVRLSEPVRKVIELARLDQVFDVFDDAAALPDR